VREQDETIQKCLGVEIGRAADETYEWNPNLCRERGIEYWLTTIPTLNQRLLYKRHVFPNVQQLISADSEEGILLRKELGLKTGPRGYTARAYVELSGNPVTLTLNVPAEMKLNYSLWINGEKQSAIGTTYTIVLPTYQRSEIEVRFESSGEGIKYGTPQLALTPNIPLYFAQSVWKPVIRLHASPQDFADDNRFLSMVPSTKDAMQKYEVPWPRYGRILRGVSLRSESLKGIWFSSVLTVTCMFYWSSMGPQTNVWRLDQGNGGMLDSVLSLEIQEGIPVLLFKTPTYQIMLRGSQSIGQANQWVHIAATLGTPLDRSKLFLNGTFATEAQPMTSGRTDVGNVAFSRLVLGGPGFEGAMGWFHIYTDTLSLSQIQRDRDYDNPKLSDKDPVIPMRRG
jgi:hypothetical protein